MTFTHEREWYIIKDSTTLAVEIKSRNNPRATSLQVKMKS